MAASSSKRMPTANKDFSCYLPLYKAVLRADWESAKKVFDEDKDAVTADITSYKDTALHLAVREAKSIRFVQNLVDLMPKEALALVDYNGDTALHFAARYGNREASRVLVKEAPELLYLQNSSGQFPIHSAAQYAHKKVLLYLLTVTGNDQPCNPFASQSGVELLVSVILCEFFDVALYMVQNYPDLATIWDERSYALKAIAGLQSAFPSGCHLNIWQHLIYSCAPVKLDHQNGPIGADIENQAKNDQALSSYIVSALRNVYAMLWDTIEQLVSHQYVKDIREQKMMHRQACKFVQIVCFYMKSLNNFDKIKQLYDEPVYIAATLGIHEVIEEILGTFPQAAWSLRLDSDGSFAHNIFRLAVKYRCENVFNIMYRIGEHGQFFTKWIDESIGTTILHLAGCLAPPQKLGLVPGAALQMQRELQWFKEVEKWVHPAAREWRNYQSKTPAMVFTEEHKDLVKEGEKWMKDTATSCTIAASLIATIVFAAAFTVPGGTYEQSGVPIFYKQKAFIAFVVADAVSLFASTTSLLVFLSILTSRYAEADFLHVLPKRLILGLITLFLSITAMIIAFTAALYLLFFQKKLWILILAASFACLPVTSFVSLQFPLLVDVISSTYGPGIFGKQRDSPLY